MITMILPTEIEELSPMPVSTSKLASMIHDPKTEIGEISRLIELDEALTANVLRKVNSAALGGREEIVSIKDAVIRLGTGQILSLIISLTTSKAMTRGFPSYNLAEHEMWRHSVACALAVENLGKLTQQNIPTVAYTGALLHDIGKLLMERHLGDDVLNSIKSVIQNEEMSWAQAERKVLGTDHAEVGGSIARHWGFPDELASLIENHHSSTYESDIVLDAIHISNMVAKLVGEGLGYEYFTANLNIGAPDRLGISISNLEFLCAKVKMQLTETEEFLRG